jgi:hypothetical protein
MLMYQIFAGVSTSHASQLDHYRPSLWQRQVCISAPSSLSKLYVADLIEPTCKNPGYEKIQAGIYMAAIQDTIGHQKLRLHIISQSKSPDDNSVNCINKDDRDNDRGDLEGGREIARIEVVEVAALIQMIAGVGW